jgi:leucine dehydrogenase
MLACAEDRWHEHSLQGRRVAVQGVGKVGYPLVKLLVEEGGANVIVSDADVDTLARAVRDFGVQSVSADRIHAVDCDVFAPCALGGIINDETIPQLRCRVVAGSANNQLERPEHGKKLAELGILYAPDFVVNAGGLINVADELRGYQPERARASVEGVYRTLRQVFTIAREDHISTAEAADRVAVSRIDRIARVRRYWVPGGKD